MYTQVASTSRNRERHELLSLSHTHTHLLVSCSIYLCRAQQEALSQIKMLSSLSSLALSSPDCKGGKTAREGMQRSDDAERKRKVCVRELFTHSRSLSLSLSHATQL